VTFSRRSLMLPRSAPSISPPDTDAVPGLRRNWRQFALLVVVNGFVGGMVGLERAVLPLLADWEFGITAKSAMFSFIVSFGLVKAITNVVAGRGAERIGRKPLLMAGWIVGLPIPFLLWYAPNWNWVTAANVLLGVNQGLCWSTTVVMKIDLVGPYRRGLAMGLNEFAGYSAVAVAAWGCALIASTYGIRTALFASGTTMATCGLLLSLFVRDTTSFARSEARAQPGTMRGIPTFRRVFVTTSLTDRNLAACSQAGLVNNLNDGVAWGLFPLLFVSRGLGVDQIGVLAAIYPAVWGISQIGTGALSDRWGRKWPIAGGMWVQAAGIFVIVAAADVTQPYAAWLAGGVLLGIGTALVYPSLLAAIGDRAEPGWRASAVGVYRLWRDLGYAVGAVLAGFLADRFSISAAIAVVGLLTLASGVIVAVRMIEE
jgi:MFS family permease